MRENVSIVAVPVIIVTTQRVLPSKAWQVDVIFNDHDVAHIEAAIQSPCCISHNQSFYAQQEENSNWVRHLERQTTTSSFPF